MEQEIKIQWPLDGDESNDCADCAYGCDYHFVDGECVRRLSTTDQKALQYDGLYSDRFEV